MDCQKIDCQKLREYLYPFIDGELDSDKIESVKEHISRCPLCRLELKNEQDVNSLFRSCFPRELAGFEMKNRIISRVRSSMKKSRSARFLKFLLPGALVAAGMLLMVFVGGDDPFPRGILEAHAAIAEGRESSDMASSSRDDLRAMLQSKLGFAVDVPDMSGSGAGLRGACICRLKKIRAAHIIYERGGHVLSAFIFPPPRASLKEARTMNIDSREYFLFREKDYNGIVWFEKGMGCMIASDLSEQDLISIASHISF